MTTSEKTLILCRDKLTSSGLDVSDAQLLYIDFLDGAATRAQHHAFKRLSSLKINYYSPKTGKPLGDWANSPPFFRLRYLENDGSAKKQQRYTQPPNTAPVAYYPQNFKWKALIDDVDAPLIITEGELKAAKACKEGFPTIGLGGVHNWRAQKLGVPFLPSLELVVWQRRNVYICFDSDYRTNQQVCLALIALAEELHRRGAFCHVVSLPQLPGLEKVGLDDFLVHAGANAAEQFRQLLVEAEPLGITAPLFELNKKYVYVQNPGLIVDQLSKFKTSPGAFKEHLQSTTNYSSRQLKQDGTVSYKTVSAAAEWLKWPLRSEVTKITYRPGLDHFTTVDDLPHFNIWPGWGVSPRDGDVGLFLKLVDHLFSGAEPEARLWFLRWCAYPLQNPGAKMFSSAVLHGVKHGTGKSLIGYTLGKIYGKNFTEISQMDLHSSFNEWAEGKQFVLGDDVTGSNKRADADFLKKLITQKELRVNGKYVPTYVVPDCINYFFTANHPDSFFLEDDDRRFFIHEIIVNPLPEEFYKIYDNWIHNENGAAAIFHYLLNLDLRDFNPSAPAFKTAAKERMIDTVRSELASWVRSLLACPDDVLYLGDKKITKDLFCAKELITIYDPTGKTGTTPQGLGRELSRAGVQQVLNGRPYRLKNGSLYGRFFAVRNRERWADADVKEVGEHLDGWADQNQPKKSKF